jgi:hypothetical protein
MTDCHYATVAGMIEHGYALRANCHDSRCHHSQQLDLETLEERLGPDHSTMHDALTPKLRCSKYGGRKVGLTVFPPYGRSLG